MKRIILTMVAVLAYAGTHAKTLVAYYSYTNNVERIVNELKTQIDCDVVEIEPADKGLDYAADNYAIGSAQIAAIRNNPNDESSYPAIAPVKVNMDEYETVIIACPLWWSQMAAPFQTFLFHYGPQMTGKNIGVIVSSASSGISGVVADAKRLVPAGVFVEPYLWIRSSQTSDAKSLISRWLKDIDYSQLTAGIDGADAGVINAANIKIYSLDGNIVASGTENFSNLSQGIYLLAYSDGTRSVTKKIIIGK